ncbi:hypothetical protein SH2C18_41080 [Clostridium sediminicola]|uniref:hypothetical protein n=1 Tax=Clostridium sediminicola TaxID=3114879 RepID=UPI0031F27462
MKILLILIIVSIVFFNFYKLEKKVSFQKRQLLLLKRENNDLKSKFMIATTSNDSEQLIVQYEKPNFSNGTTSTNCKLYSAPIVNSNILSGVLKNTPLQIQDSAFSSNKLWYEVNLPSRNRINSKGWVEDKDIIIIDEITHGKEIRHRRF